MTGYFAFARGNLIFLIEPLVWLISAVLLLYRLRIYFRGGECTVWRDHSGRVAVITGAAQGVGKETMQELLAHGCTVVFGDRDVSISKATLAQLSARYPEKVHYIYLDLGDRASIE